MSVFFRIKGLFLIFLISLHFCVSSMSNYRKVCHILYREAVFSLEDYQALEKSSLLEEFWSQGRKRHLLYSRILPFILEKAMAPHSSTLAWKIPWTEEPGKLQSMGSLRVGHDWATSLSLFTFMHWRRKWQPTPVFLPGDSQGRGSLVGCHLWGRTELDTTDVT